MIPCNFDATRTSDTLGKVRPGACYGQPGKMQVWTENVSVVGRCECALKFLECVVCECECAHIECALLSMTVQYLGDAHATARWTFCVS